MEEKYMLEAYANKFKGMANRNLEQAELIQEGRTLLSSLVSCQGWLNETLSQLVLDDEFVKSQWLSIDYNEVILYRSAQKEFSVRAYIWEAGLKYPVHDHGAWGIVGAHINPIRERKYDLIAQDLERHHAEVKMTADKVLNPGDTTVVMPLNDGIHQMEALDRTAVTIHIYGPPVRKGYIQAYDLHFKQVTRMYSPYLQKKVLAIRALGSITDSWSEAILNEALQTNSTDFIRLECTDALKARKRLFSKD
ncbi:cysteine dioxygenase [hydrocarbon metagenome]|uniref:Cysteine dioxygenase n=1 Tax=hydrocarbon metagenome TaxID=938273 RepID=A0A0W8E1K1_9ZZZZ